MPGVNRNQPKRAASSESRYTAWEMREEFPDDAACLDYLWRKLYSDDGAHAQCPKCLVRRKFHRVASRPSYSCDTCGHHVHPTAGTIFHKSSTSLTLWFHAIYLLSSTRCGISAKQLEREIGVTNKTAWRMFHMIRNLLLDDDKVLAGPVEADETYVGGVRRNGRTGRPGRQDKTKTPVFGMVERGGNVIALAVEDAKATTLMPHLHKRVLPASLVYTDEWRSYDRLGEAGFEHRRIHHASKVYVVGDIHTNTIEGFWSLVKRGIDGVYHAVSARHLQSYLDEYTWRYNHRDDEEPMFKTMLAGVQVGHRPVTPRRALAVD
jgi:transposase